MGIFMYSDSFVQLVLPFFTPELFMSQKGFICDVFSSEEGTFFQLVVYDMPRIL